MSDAAALWSALAPLLAILVQAGAYWLMARSWVLRANMPLGAARVFLTLRAGNVLLLGAGLVGVLWWWPADPFSTTLILLVWAFGVVEYINYFFIRLGYPAATWIDRVRRRSRPRLRRDVEKALA